MTKTIDELLQESLRLKKIYQKAREKYKIAEKAYHDAWTERQLSFRSPEEKMANEQRGKCTCRCNCDNKVRGNWQGGRVVFWPCSDCSTFCR